MAKVSPYHTNSPEWGGPDSVDGLEFVISISGVFSSSSLSIFTFVGFTAVRSAAHAAEGSE